MYDSEICVLINTFCHRCLMSPQWNTQVSCLSPQRVVPLPQEASPLMKTHMAPFTGKFQEVPQEATLLAQLLQEHHLGVMTISMMMIPQKKTLKIPLRQSMKKRPVFEVIKTNVIVPADIVMVLCTEARWPQNRRSKMGTCSAYVRHALRSKILGLGEHQY